MKQRLSDLVQESLMCEHQFKQEPQMSPNVTVPHQRAMGIFGVYQVSHTLEGRKEQSSHVRFHTILPVPFPVSAPRSKLLLFPTETTFQRTHP